MYFVFWLVCFVASLIGAICGIGGGVIIKPVLDAVGILNIEKISFLSGCTVLAMTSYSVIKSKISHSGNEGWNKEIGVPLVIGAVTGGMLGKVIFQFFLRVSSSVNQVGMLQAGALLLITIATLLYTLKKADIKSIRVRKYYKIIMIGSGLGMLSAFLGIGGGPINLVVLFYFFSMGTKTAIEYSLYIIFFSQMASLLQSIVTKTIPEVKIEVLLLMVIGGILGGVLGRYVNKKIKEKVVERLFMGSMVMIILINIYNIYQFIQT